MSIEDGNSIDGKNKAGRTITALSTKELAKLELGPMKHGKSDVGRRNSPAKDKKPARSKDTNHANDIDKERKNAPVQKSKKRILTISQMEKVSESLYYPESKKSISEDNVIQGRMELSEKHIEFVINDNTKQSMTKDCIEIVDVDNNERILNMNMRLGYFGLRLYDRLKISEIDKLLKIVDQIEGRSIKILLDTGCSIYVFSSRFAERNCYLARVGLS